jgi:hypothetical protein
MGPLGPMGRHANRGSYSPKIRPIARSNCYINKICFWIVTVYFNKDNLNKVIVDKVTSGYVCAGDA